jgi:hypothetical protein
VGVERALEGLVDPLNRADAFLGGRGRAEAVWELLGYPFLALAGAEGLLYLEIDTKKSYFTVQSDKISNSQNLE